MQGQYIKSSTKRKISRDYLGSFHKNAIALKDGGCFPLTAKWF